MHAEKCCNLSRTINLVRKQEDEKWNHLDTDLHVRSRNNLLVRDCDQEVVSLRATFNRMTFLSYHKWGDVLNISS